MWGVGLGSIAARHEKRLDFRVIQSEIDWKIAVPVTGIGGTKVDKGLGGREMAEHCCVVKRSVAVFSWFVDVRTMGNQDAYCLGITPLRADVERRLTRELLRVYRLHPYTDEYISAVYLGKNLRQCLHAA